MIHTDDEPTSSGIMRGLLLEKAPTEVADLARTTAGPFWTWKAPMAAKALNKMESLNIIVT